MIYTAVTGQSMHDVCLITYGSLDYLVKLAADNNIADLNSTNLTGIEFTYDNSLIVNQTLHQQLNQNFGTAEIDTVHVFDAFGYVTEDSLSYYAPSSGGDFYYVQSR